MIKLAGFVPFSAVDWPGKIAASVFAQGCPFRCDYCHNFEILDPKAPGTVEWSEVTDLLEERKGLLDGVVFSGGEAILQGITKRGETILETPLGLAMKEVKELGFEVGLHAAGSFPKVLENLFQNNLVDWVGLDVKALPEDYEFIVKSPVSSELIENSLEKVMNHPEVDHEIRLTLWPGLLNAPSFRELQSRTPEENGEELLDYAFKVAEWVRERGAENFALQKFQTMTVQEKAMKTPLADWSEETAEEMLKEVGFDSFVVR